MLVTCTGIAGLTAQVTITSLVEGVKTQAKRTRNLQYMQN